MSTIFEELANLDRPLVDVNLLIGGVAKTLKARRPNALDADAIEAYYSDEYARLIVAKTERPADKPDVLCELEQMRLIYAGRTKEELIGQLLQTREDDIQRLAFEKAQFDVQAELKLMLDRTDEEKEAYLAERREQVKAAIAEASAEIRSEYEAREFEELVDLISQVNVNVKAIGEAQSSKAAMYLYYVLCDENGKQICPSAESVKSRFTIETIRRLVKEINSAFLLQSAPDLPFVSQGDDAPGGQPTSQEKSPQAQTPLKRGGRRTKATKEN